MVEGVIIKYGHFEVDPSRMKIVKQQYMTEEEVERIVQMRHDYLEWMHYNFAKKVLKPPKEEAEEGHK